MKILHDLDELAALKRRVFLAIGVFDGVHLGHQALLRAAREDAAGLRRAEVAASSTQAGAGEDAWAVAMTFDPPPPRVLRPKDPLPFLTSLAHKLHLFELQYVQAAFVQRFDLKFAAIPPRAFLQQLHDALGGHLREICVGHNFRFGHNRAGDPELILKMGGELGFAVKVIEPVKVGDEVVSSTAVRRAVAKGELDKAVTMLGRAYSVWGKVTRGSGRGEKIGFPTANVDAGEDLLPPNGVYAVRVTVAAVGDRGIRDQRSRLQGAANIGLRPTFEKDHDTRILEIHLFDFCEKIYGTKIEVEFAEKLRNEQKFSSVEELKGQIERDVKAAREILGR